MKKEPCLAYQNMKGYMEEYQSALARQPQSAARYVYKVTWDEAGDCNVTLPRPSQLYSTLTLNPQNVTR